jgi:YesN/AraC family two-component response regulator
MPLTNNVIIKLNEITTMIEDKSKISESEIDEIKSIFKTLVENGERYDIDEIEFWFENEGSWTKKESRIRLVNISNYIQDKFQQTLHLKIISDDDCSCDN